MEKEEKLVSLSGDPIYRYTDGGKEWESPHGEMAIEEITDHIEQYFGKIEMVYHEILSDTVHIDVHHIKPTKDRPFNSLITSGMSDLPMSVPDDFDAPKYLELMVTLPKDWNISQDSFKEEKWYWPVRLLKYLARFPHKYDSWLGWGHTIPNGDPAEPFSDNISFTGVIILPSITVPQKFGILKIDDEKEIVFMCYIPLYDEEMDLKLRKGSDVLLDKFDKFNITDIVDIKRRNVAKKRFGVF